MRTLRNLLNLPRNLCRLELDTRRNYRQHCVERGCRPHRAWSYRWGFALAVGFLTGLAAYATTDPAVYMFEGRHDVVNGFLFAAVGIFSGWALTSFNYTMHKAEHLRQCGRIQVDTPHIRTGDEG